MHLDNGAASRRYREKNDLFEGVTGFLERKIQHPQETSQKKYKDKATHQIKIDREVK